MAPARSEELGTFRDWGEVAAHTHRHLSHYFRYGHRRPTATPFCRNSPLHLPLTLQFGLRKQRIS